METNNLYFIKISGQINPSKQKEFQQTVQFVFNHLPSQCIEKSLALDVHHPELYHLYSLWKSEGAVMTFKGSNEFELLKGAFQTLGSYKDTVTGRKANIQLFELNHLGT